jgi:hypothetical protein
MAHSVNLQKAIYAALDAADIDGVTQIVDHPLTTTDDDDFPFIQIGASQVIADDSGGADGSGDEGKTEYIDLHSWSRLRGQTQVKTIMGAIYDALHHQSLTVVGRSSAYCWLDDERVIDDRDGLTRHGIQTFKITHRT